MGITIANNENRLAGNWLKLAVAALGTGGIFSILLVLARAPRLQEVIPFRDFFHTALITHVNLTVLVWFMAMTCFVWTLNSRKSYGWLVDAISKAGFMSFAAGAFLIAASPFIGEPAPLLNNYIPVLQNVTFALGLGLIASGVLLMLIWKFLAEVIEHYCGSSTSTLSIAYMLPVIPVAAALICFALSDSHLSNLGSEIYEDKKHYYELLFWSGGHVLQFSHTQVLLACWITLLIACIPQLKYGKLTSALLWLNALFVVPAPLIHSIYPINSAEFYDFFTWHMRILGGVAPTLLAGVIIFTGISTACRLPPPPAGGARGGNLSSSRSTKTFPPLNPPPQAMGETSNVHSDHRTPTAFHYLTCSFIMFMAGGVIGLMISGSNVTIPAHYHGSIVGISIAMMGLAVYSAPRLGFGELKRKTCLIQVYLITLGQLMHIIGLAISGGYGAARKSEALITNPNVKIGMGMMGFGGMLAIIGGLIFVVMMYRSFKQQNNQNHRVF